MVDEYVIELLSKKILGDLVWSPNPGQEIRKWREVFGVSQAQLGKQMGVHQSVIADYERGRRKPGVDFIKKMVKALIEIDGSRGFPVVKSLAKGTTGLGPYVISEGDFAPPVRLDEVVKTLGYTLNVKLSLSLIHGWLVVDSVKAILYMEGADYYQLLSNSVGRLLVFTNVSNGRSPMIALRVGVTLTPLKPGAVVIHRPTRSFDQLALLLAIKSDVPIIISTKKTVSDLIETLKSLGLRST